ncbi:MAG: tetratricopeptide repeat protein [Prevotella sp.]|nr:tetratricopeptide repeat protein [Prevotella sp.]
MLKRYEDLRDSDIDTFLDPDEYADVAEYYHSNGDNEAALEAVERALEIFPGAIAPLCFRARYALIVEGDINKANALAEQIEDKFQVEYVYLKAELLIADNKMEEANTYLEQQMQYLEDVDEYALDIASMLMEYEEIDYAEKWLKRCNLTEDNEYKELSARIMLRRGNYEESERLFNELIDSDPYSSSYWNQLASSQFLHNNIQDSITSSEFSLAINPDDDEALLNKANALFTLGNHREALIFYKRFVEKQPENESAVMMVGITLSHLQRLDEALDYLEKAVVLSEDHNNDINFQQALQELTYLEDVMGNTEGALHNVDRMDQYLRKHHRSEMQFAKLVHIPRGYILLEHKRFEEAIQEFQHAFILAQGNPEIIYYICIAVYDTGYFRLAYKLFGVLFRMVSDDWRDGYAYYARCCLLVGDMEDFDAAVKKAVAVNPEEARFALEVLYPEGTQPEDYPTTPLKNLSIDKEEQV